MLLLKVVYGIYQVNKNEVVPSDLAPSYSLPHHSWQNWIPTKLEPESCVSREGMSNSITTTTSDSQSPIPKRKLSRISNRPDHNISYHSVVGGRSLAAMSVGA